MFTCFAMVSDFETSYYEAKGNKKKPGFNLAFNFDINFGC